MAAIDEEKLNMQIRKFLKNVGVTSQREIEASVRKAVDQARLEGDAVRARVILELPDLDVTHVIEQDIEVR
jgi:hypothetical protein